ARWSGGGWGGRGGRKGDARPAAGPGQQPAAGPDGDLVPADVRDLHAPGQAADLARQHADAVGDRALVAGLEQPLHADADAEQRAAAPPATADPGRPPSHT